MKQVIINIDGLLWKQKRPRVAYVMLSVGDLEFPIRVTVQDRYAAKDFPLINLERFGQGIYAYPKETELAGKVPLKDLAMFLYSERLKLEDRLGKKKFTEIDRYICRFIKKCA
jgi:hypothetical protein